jgi:Family of unknown function (DUF6263)
MRLWRVSVGLVALACVVGAGLLMPAFAQDPPKEAKFSFEKSFGQAGKSFFQKLETTTDQDMSVEGKTGQPAMKQTQKQTFVIKWTPKEEKDGKYVLEQKIDYVKMNILIGTTTIQYDSEAKDQPKNPMTEFFDSLMRVELTVYVNKSDMKVSKIDGREKFVDKLAENHPQMKSLLKNILSEDAIKTMSYQTWAGIPLGEKKVGYEWTPDTKDTKLDLGAIGTYINTYKYKFDSVKDGQAKIIVTPTMEYKAPDAAKGGADALPFVIKSTSNLKSVADKCKGEIFFDLEKGRIASSNMEMKIDGKVVIDIGGQETPVLLTQTQVSKLKTADSKDGALK